MSRQSLILGAAATATAGATGVNTCERDREGKLSECIPNHFNDVSARHGNTL